MTCRTPRSARDPRQMDRAALRSPAARRFPQVCVKLWIVPSDSHPYYTAVDGEGQPGPKTARSGFHVQYSPFSPRFFGGNTPLRARMFARQALIRPEKISPHIVSTPVDILPLVLFFRMMLTVPSLAIIRQLPTVRFTGKAGLIAHICFTRRRMEESTGCGELPGEKPGEMWTIVKLRVTRPFSPRLSPASPHGRQPHNTRFSTFPHALLIIKS